MFVHRERSERSTASDGASGAEDQENCERSEKFRRVFLLARQRKRKNPPMQTHARSKTPTVIKSPRRFKQERRRPRKLRAEREISPRLPACPTTQEEEPALQTRARSKTPPVIKSPQRFEQPLRFIVLWMFEGLRRRGCHQERIWLSRERAPECAPMVR